MASKIDWVIVGGESGHNARPIQKEWVESIQKQCEDAKVPFFFKQWGGYNEKGIKGSKKDSSNFLNGVQYLEIPIPKK